MTKEKPSGGSWRTKKVYMLKRASLGAVLSEREMTAWNGDQQPTAWADRWLHYDRMGNVLLLTDSAGAILAQYEQEAFGSVVSGGQAGFHMTGKEYDLDAGLYYFGSRWYAPGTSAFLQGAPFPPDLEHPYSIAEQNPLMLVDPLGNIPYWAAAACGKGAVFSVLMRLFSQKGGSPCEQAVGYACTAAVGCGAGVLGGTFGKYLGRYFDKFGGGDKIEKLLQRLLPFVAGASINMACKPTCDSIAETLCNAHQKLKTWDDRNDEQIEDIFE